MKKTSRTQRPLLRWPGGKARLSKWIIGMIPPDHYSYTEAFGGAASVLINKPRSRMETINDWSGDLIHFLQTFRDHSDELIDKIRWTYWSKAEWELAFEPTDDPIERARRFHVRCWMSVRQFDKNPSYRRQYFVSTGKKDGGSPMSAAATVYADIDYLYDVAIRMRGVAIEQGDALKFLVRFDHETAVHYIDSPYPFSTRARKTKIYPRDDMDDNAHRELAEVARSLKGFVLVSGYSCPLYKTEYEDHGWTRRDKVAQIDGGGTKTESLWLSPRTTEALRKPKQRRWL